MLPPDNRKWGAGYSETAPGTVGELYTDGAADTPE